jgi:uncharacterized protein YkuJ
MQQDRNSQNQMRRFEQFGIEVCQVNYDQVTQTYRVIEYRPYNEFTFDDMDLAAIEIYDCLSELQLTF